MVDWSGRPAYVQVADDLRAPDQIQ